MTDLYTKHQAKVAKAARIYFDNPSDLEDALQEAHIKLYDMSVNANNEEAYIVTMAHNLFRDIVRKNQRVAELDNEASIGDGIDSCTPYEVMLFEQEGEEFERTLDDLPEDLRIVARLYYVAGYSYNRISEELNLPLGTVGSRLNKARKFFQGG